MSHHDSHHPETISEKSPKTGPAFLLTIGLLIVLLLPVLGALVLTPSATATENEDAARAALRTKNLNALQAADAAEASF